MFIPFSSGESMSSIPGSFQAVNGKYPGSGEVQKSGQEVLF